MNTPKILILNPEVFARKLRRLAYWKALSQNTYVIQEKHDGLGQELVGWLVDLIGGDRYHATVESPNKIIKKSSEAYFNKFIVELEAKLLTCDSSTLIKYIIHIEAETKKYQNQYQLVIDKAININQRNADAAQFLKKTAIATKWASDVTLTVFTSGMGWFAFGVAKSALESYVNDWSVVIAVAKKGEKKLKKEVIKSLAIVDDKDVKALEATLLRNQTKLSKVLKGNKLGVNAQMTASKIAKTVNGRVNSKYVTRSANNVIKSQKELKALRKLKTKNLGRLFKTLSVLTATKEMYDALMED